MTKTMPLVLLFSALIAVAYSDSPLPLGPNQNAVPSGQPTPATNGESENPCVLEPRSGMCLAYIPSFYYNPSTGKCHDFVFGGCDGNANRFWSEEDCMKRCGGTAKGSESSEDASSNAESSDGDQSSSEAASQDPSETSTPSSEEQEDPSRNAEETESSIPDMCKQPAVSGTCRAFLPRFYFNDGNGKCESFIYGGCDGNSNNFKSEEECENSCHLYPRQE